MRDAGGHSADRLQLLRLDHLELHRPQLLERTTQPGFRLRALGDVLAGRHDADHRTAGVLHDVGTKVYRKHGPVAPDVGRLVAPARDILELVPLQLIAGAWGCVDADVLANQLVDREPMHPGVGRVRIDDTAGEIGDDDAELHRLKGLLESPQRLAGQRLLGRVVAHLREPAGAQRNRDVGSDDHQDDWSTLDRQAEDRRDDLRCAQDDHADHEEDRHGLPSSVVGEQERRDERQ